MKKAEDKYTVKVYVKGLVQGVGFRPFIYRHAKKYDLKGRVENRNDGVVIKVQGNKKFVEKFISSIKTKAPVASNIIRIFSEETEPENFSDFRIIKSKNTSDEITDISPDISVCDECLKDMKIQPNRINYPFINCTNCGPRFTIIKDLPYDRKKTTMAPFIMCKSCAAEYKDISDRRFHAQPVACSICGPEYELIYKGKIINDFQKILKIVCELIEAGKIIAIKGLGGFHIACDAQNEEVVKRLREAKNRDGKPFAVMFSDIESLKDYTVVNDVHASLLQSWRRPILLLNEKKKLAPDVNVGFDTIGVMLPYMPFHYLLFEKLNIPVIVLTSGNISDEPIIIDNEEAKKQLTGISDALLIYNREIYNRTDDSVAMVVNNKERIIRRSRGFTPTPVELKINADGILATGAELVNCFCIGKGKQAILSQHIGDLKNIETLEFYTETIEQFKKLFRVKPTLIACDKHPDYLSTKYANDLELPKIQIQHHHAHIASCMAEHGLDEKVIGVAFDGVGLGENNKIWGGEFFVCDLNAYNRITHFDYIPMPGGDKATKNPWRMAVSFLYKFFGKDFLNFNLPFLENINNDDIDLLLYAIDKNINCPLASSAGRLFDAVAALTNICTFSTFHAEAPMRLESLLDDNCNEYYDFEIRQTIKFNKTFKGIVDDIKSGIKASVISAKFHNTIINIIFAVVSDIRKNHNINKVVLSGGSFQNRYILEKVENLLKNNGFNVFSHKSIPTNDGGIALGQLAIAAKRREMDLF